MIPGNFTPTITSEMASLSYSRWQNRKEHPNLFTNNEGMGLKA